MTEVEFTNRLDRELAIGTSKGLKQGADFIMGMATARFSDKKDREAGNLRDLADKLYELSEAEYPE